MNKIVLLIFLTSVSLNVMGQMTVSVSTTNSCNHDGTATAIASGGSGPYTYKWFKNDNSIVIGTASSISGISDGFLMVEVTDANSQIQYSYGNVNPVFAASLNVTPVTCNNDGAATITATGGAGPYTYSWGSGQTSQTISNLPMGAYPVVITDANGCERRYSDTAYINSNTPVILNLSSTVGDCNVRPSASVSPSGGLTPYTYYWNTTPVQTTATITGLTAGNSYNVIVTDANGCTQSGTAYPYNNANALDLNITSSPEVCNNHTGSISVTPNTGVAPYSYLWSNGMITQTITGLAEGYYIVYVTDGGGCESNRGIFVDNSSPISSAFSGGSSTCVNGNGSLTISAWDGTPPYSYLWSNGQTTSTVNNLNNGSYNVVISDAAGCSKTKDAYIDAPWSCTHGFVTGIVFNDINGNCIQDAGENGIADAMVYISPGGYGVSTGWDGSYSAYVVPGTYIVSHAPLTNWTQICPASPGTITVNVTSPGNTYSNNDFGDQVTPGIQDLEVKLYCGDGRPGSTAYSWLTYKNNGGSVMSGAVSYTHNNLVTFNSSYPPANNYNSTTLTAQWNFVNLLPGEERWIEPQILIPIGTALGTHLNSSISISPTIGDMILSNNVDSCYGVVIGSYDPNELSVSPQGATNYGYITTSDSVLSYMINFQNTGTDTAFVVIVRDTLDSHLDQASVHDLFSSHDVKLNVKGNVLEFTFNNINLLDSTHNEKASHAFVSFKIKVKKSTPIGTTISNKADIYFDYNVPVTTNGVMNTLKQNVTGITNAVTANALLQVYPNPTQGDFTVSYDLPNASSVSLKLFSVLGEEMTVMQATQQNKGINSIRFSAKENHVSPGIYILKLYSDEYIFTTKVILTE